MKKGNFDYSKLFFWMPSSIYLRIIYKLKMKKSLNLRNPVTYNEKMQWLKLHDHNPMYSKLVDKYEVKDIVSKKIGKKYIIPTYGVYDDFDDIDFEKLPKSFVIKCTHDSGGVVICKDKNSLNIKEARDKINNSLNRNYYYRRREWPYKAVRPRIIIEKYIDSKDKKDLCDYKLFCFNGSPKIILVCSERFSSDNMCETWFDEDWNHLSIVENNHRVDPTIPRPKLFKEMKKLAAVLSKDIPMVRVDFYEANNKLLFGEMTFFPASGFERFKPEKWDKIMGDMIDLKKLKK